MSNIPLHKSNLKLYKCMCLTYLKALIFYIKIISCMSEKISGIIVIIACTVAIGLLSQVAYSDVNYASAQEPKRTTFQEQAQVIIDGQITRNATASISLLSTSNQEIKIPTELENRILAEQRISSIILTNEEQCVLGVVNDACIMINIKRDPEWAGINAIQDGAKEISNQYIDEINKVFDTRAKFHSVFIHYQDESNSALGTSGIISGKGTISAVYTMPLEDTFSMYQKISTILIPSVIRNAGGFYQTALELSDDENSKMGFSMIKQGDDILYQLKLSVDYPYAQTDAEINPLEYLKTDRLERSEYFKDGFYPLGSLLQIVILLDEAKKISETNGNMLPTFMVEGEKIPKDLDKPGWVFDPESGQKIEGRYIFGKESFADKDELIIVLSPLSQNNDKLPISSLDPKNDTKKEPHPNKSDNDAYVVIPIIIAVAAAASIYYLKGYKGSKQDNN
jgi:hypothetical protein